MPTDAEKAAMAEIKKLGGNVLEIAQNDARLDVAFHLADTKINDTHLALVKSLPKTMILNLRGTEITDERRLPLVAYLGDSAPEGLDACPAMFEAQPGRRAFPTRRRGQWSPTPCAGLVRRACRA